MDDLLGRLEFFLDSSKTPDQQTVNEATAFIMEVRSKPDGILILLTLFARTGNLAARHAAAVNIMSLVNQVWPSLSPEIQDQARALLLQALQLPNLRREEISVLASACSLIFESMITAGTFWNELIKLICTYFQQRNFAFTVLLLSRIFPAMPASLIAESYAGFRNMAYAGLSDESLEVCIDATSVFFRIASVTKDVEILKPVITFLYPECERSLELDKKEFELIWAAVAKLLRFDGIPMENVMSFFTIAMGFITGKDVEIDKKLLMLDAFLPTVSVVEPSVLEVFLQCSIAMAIDVANQEEILPEEYLAMPEKMLTTRPQKEITPVIQGKIEQLLSGGGNVGQVVVGIMLLSLLLGNGQGCLKRSVEFVKGALLTGLKSSNDLVLLASLAAVKMAAEAEMAELTVDMLRETMNLVVSVNEDVRNKAYDALMTLCEACDSDVDGLFDAIWSFQTKNMITPDDLENYILLVAHVTRLSNDINDEKLDKLVHFIGTIFSSDQDLVIKSAALQLVSTLLTKRESLISELLPAVTPVLNESLTFSNDGVVCQALAFIQNLVMSFGSSVGEIVAPYCEGIGQLIKDYEMGTRVFMSALQAASILVRSFPEPGLIQTLIAACTSLVQVSDIYSRINGCETVASIAKIFASPEHIKVGMELFNAMGVILEEEDDVDVLNAALEGMTKLLKKCRLLAPAEFDERSLNLIRSIFGGSIKYLNGSVQLLFDAPPAFIEYLMDFVAVYVRNGQGVSDICKFVVEWIPNASESVLGSLTAVISDAISFNKANVDPQLVGATIEVINSVAASVTDVDTRQNIVVLLYSMLKAEAIDLAAANNIVPLLNQWWNEGKSEVVGQRVFLSNIAVFYLDLYVRGGAVDNGILLQSILSFPPADLKESQQMSQLMLMLMSKNPCPELCRAFALAMGDFLTEPKAVSDKRKVKEDTKSQLVTIFNTVASDETLRGAILERIGDNQQKVQALGAFFV